MSRSFKKLIQTPFGRFGVIFLALSLLLVLFGLFCKSTITIVVSLFCYLIGCVLCLIFVWSYRFDVPGLSKHYSENFFGIKSISGRWYISETKPPKNLKKSTEAQRTYKKSLLADAKNSNLLPEGNYYALTHKTVISKLEKNKRVKIENKKPLYKGKVPGKLRKDSREFYLIKFSVKK